MVRRTTCWVLILCLLATTVAVASNNDDPVPSWVPWILVATTVVAGALYLVRWRHRGERPPKTPKEAALDLIAYVSTDQEREELKSLVDEGEVGAFLQKFFEDRDPTPSTPENEFRAALTSRYLQANREFGDHREGWETDRGRIFILHGRPEEVRNYPMLEVSFGRGVMWKSAEIWVYSNASGTNELPRILTDDGLFLETFGSPPPMRGRMLFIFGRLGEGGPYNQVFSTEPGEKIDHRIYDIP